MIKLSAFSDEGANTLDGQIKILQKNNISLAEIRSIDCKNIREYDQRDVKEFKRALDGSGIGVSAIGSMIGKAPITVNIDEYLDEVKKICEFASILNTKRIRAFSFYEAYNERERVIDYLSRIVETAKSYSLDICHENEKLVYGDTLERVLDLKANVKGLKLVYDPANFLQVGESSKDTLNKLHGEVEYFHIKDVLADGETIVPAGYGEGQIAKLIDMIEDDKILTLEPHLMEFSAYKSIDSETLKGKFSFKNNEEAFDFAVASLKKILSDCNYKEIKGAFVK